MMNVVTFFDLFPLSSFLSKNMQTSGIEKLPAIITALIKLYRLQ